MSDSPNGNTKSIYYKENLKNFVNYLNVKSLQSINEIDSSSPNSKIDKVPSIVKTFSYINKRTIIIKKTHNQIFKENKEKLRKSIDIMPESPLHKKKKLYNTNNYNRSKNKKKKK